MGMEDFITELFCRVDDALQAVREHLLSKLTPAELVVIGLLLVTKGRGQRAFAVALFNPLIDSHGLLPDEHGFVSLSYLLPLSLCSTRTIG